MGKSKTDKKSTNPIAVLGDIHGCLNALKNIYKKISKHKIEIYSVGDIIDRGADITECVEFAIRKNIKPVMGNHEKWMLEGIARLPTINSFRDWILTGGNTTIESYSKIKTLETANEFVKLLYENKHLEFVKSFPKYYLFEKVIISHAGIVKGLNDEEMVFNSSEPLKLEQFQVFGHFAKAEPDFKEEWYMNIDTACVYGGYLTALIINPNTSEIIDIIQEKN